MVSEPKNWVRALTNVRLDDRGELGGKAAVLGELLARGLPVLQGVAVSCKAYESVVDEPELAQLTAEYWNTTQKADRDRASSEIGQHLASSPVAAEVSRTVLRTLAELGIEGDLIVRSSATSEDGQRSSFAGQFVSVRSQADAAALSRAIATVWSSATSSHVIEYLSHLSPQQDEAARIGMGVLIQSFQEFEIAGILFSQHPTVRLADWALVEFLDAAPDRIVGGEVTPHRVRLRMSDAKLLWEHRAKSSADLSQQTADELVGHCSAAIDLLSADVDIEWGQQKERVVVLQARPATQSPWGDE